MTQAEAFEQAILANPEDETCRLAYADWLEERGDFRGEYLRIEMAVARGVKEGEDHAALRQRLNHLRAKVYPVWGTTFGLYRISAIEDLVYYLRHFHRHWNVSPSMDPSLLPSDLPEGLWLIYRELGGLFTVGDYDSPLGTQDHLMRPDQLQPRDGMVEFLRENQGVWSCRYTAGVKDSAVYSDVGDEVNFLKVCDSLNRFLVTFCLREAVFSAPCLVFFREARLKDILTGVCRTLWLNGQYVYEERDYDFFDAPGHDVLIMDGPEDGLWLGAHSDVALRLLKPEVEFQRIH